MKHARIGTSALAIVLAALAGRPAQAQRMGIVAGANFSTLADLQAGGIGLQSFSASSGYHVGLFAEVGGPVALRPSLIYLNAGSMFSGSSLLSVSTFDLSYLAVPVDIKFNLVPVVYFFGGPEFQMLLSANAQPDFEDDLRSFVAHGAAGMGFQISRLHFEGRYVFGLTGITTDTYTVGGFSVTGGDQVSNAVRVSVGVSF